MANYDIFTVHLFSQTCGTFEMLNTNNSNILFYMERKSIPIYDFNNYITDKNMNVYVHITQKNESNHIQTQQDISEPSVNQLLFSVSIQI